MFLRKSLYQKHETCTCFSSVDVCGEYNKTKINDSLYYGATRSLIHLKKYIDSHRQSGVHNKLYVPFGGPDAKRRKDKLRFDDYGIVVMTKIACL